MKRFLKAYINREKPEYSYTLEGLSAQTAYNSLGEDRIEYSVFSKSLDPVFLAFTPEELKIIEKYLPPYPEIVSAYYKKRQVSEEEIKVLNKKLPFYQRLTRKGRQLAKSKKEISNKLLPEEWLKIQQAYNRKVWYDFRKTLIPLYATGILSTYLATHNLFYAIYWLTGILPYYGLKIASDKIMNRTISKHLDRIASLYFFGRYTFGAVESMAEFGFIAPQIGKLMEKAWSYTPKPVRKIIDKTEKFLTGVKPKKFDEKEMRIELYSVPDTISTGLPTSTIEKYKEDLDNELIEVEDPRRTLTEPFTLSYHSRKAVVINDKIIDKQWVRKLAEKEGRFLDSVEEEVVKRPWKHLGIDVVDGKIAWVRDIIGILPSKRKGLHQGLIRKEGYLTLLGKQADELTLLLQNPSESADLVSLLRKPNYLT